MPVPSQPRRIGPRPISIDVLAHSAQPASGTPLGGKGVPGCARVCQPGQQRRGGQMEAALTGTSEPARGSPHHRTPNAVLRRLSTVLQLAGTGKRVNQAQKGEPGSGGEATRSRCTAERLGVGNRRKTALRSDWGGSRTWHAPGTAPTMGVCQGVPGCARVVRVAARQGGPGYHRGAVQSTRSAISRRLVE